MAQAVRAVFMEWLMDSWHPNTDEAHLEQALLAVVAALVLILALQYYLGHWDKFIEQAVVWFPIWRWGG